MRLTEYNYKQFSPQKRRENELSREILFQISPLLQILCVSPLLFISPVKNYSITFLAMPAKPFH